MTAPALALAPVLTDHRTGTGASTRTLDAELLDRATRDDYHHWLATALPPGDASARSGCAAPSATSTPRPARSSHALDTDDTPDKVIYLPCGDRRASVCPPCAETYRADTYQLIRAGLAGGKGVPESVAIHPCVFATFTAPSFGPVHTRVITAGGTAWPGADPAARPATARTGGGSPAASGTKKTTPAWAGRCARTATTTTPPSSGTPTPPSCGAAPSSPSAASLDKLARTHGARVRLSYAKVAEFQRRGLIHFHAIFRLDGIDPEPPRAHRPAPASDHRRCAGRSHPPGRRRRPGSPPSPTRPSPSGWDITWGAQVDPRVVRLTDDGQITDVAVASYLAKYATKSTEPVGVPPGRITADNAAHLRRPAHPPGTADHRLPQARHPPARGLPGAAPLGAHARLPRPLRHQKPPLLHHHARAPRRPPRLAPPPAPPHPARRRQDRHHRHRPANGPDEAGAPRRRPPRALRRRPSPRAPAHRARRSQRCLTR